MSDERQPYEPPRSDVQDVVPIRPRPVKGIVVGAVVDLGGTLVASIVLSVIVSFRLASQGMTPEEIQQALVNLSMTSGLSIFSMVLGTGFSVLGGYVCATYAKKDIYGCGVILGVIVCTAGIMMGGMQQSIAMDLLMVLVTFAAVLFGAWLYGRKHPEHAQ